MQDAENAPGLDLRATDPFLKDLRGRVQAYFETSGRTARDCPRMYAKTAVVLGWFGVSYISLVFFASTWWTGALASLSLALAIAAVGFNVQHDGSHRAYSRRLWVNKLMAASMDLVGASSFLWARKHNTFHHTYTNITGQDDDIDLTPLGRFSPHQRRWGFHRFQHLYLWFFYGFITLKWHLLDDFYDLARGKVGNHPLIRPRGHDLVVLIAGKVISFSLAFVIPALVHPFWLVLAFYAGTLWISGIVLSVVFQLAHVVEEAEFPSPEKGREELRAHWARHQLRTTVDFARGSRMLTWFLGGLNFQVEHHLFPRVCHIHYPALSRLVEEACAEAGVPYNAHPTFLSSLASHFHWLRRMGEAPAAAATK
jgi:linoleoyl-CoA desaturase